MRLSPPAKNVFYFSMLMALAALVLYVLDGFGVIGGSLHYAFWIAIVGWAAMTVGVVATGV